jgi:hypothetical protein
MDSTDFMILDRRVADNVNGYKGFVVNCDERVPLSQIIATVKQQVQKQRGVRMKRLVIFGHGIEAKSGDGAYSEVLHQCKGTAGGYGVELGRDYLTTSKTGEFAELRGHFAPEGVIEFRSCAIADVSPDQALLLNGEGYLLSGNGRRLLLEIAAHADVKVKAADAVQFMPMRINEKFLGFRMGNTLEFTGNEKWHGKVYLFDPNTQSAKRVQG